MRWERVKTWIIEIHKRDLAERNLPLTFKGYLRRCFDPRTWGIGDYISVIVGWAVPMAYITWKIWG